MDYLKNKCPVCMKHFCCSAHRADHEVKNHSEMFPKLKQDFLVKLFEKRGKALLMKSEKRLAPQTQEGGDNYINEIRSNSTIPRNNRPAKRVHSEVNRNSSTSIVSVSETRKILVPIHRLSETHYSNNGTQLKPNHQHLPTSEDQKASRYDVSTVKTSTPILENLSREKTPTSNWDYISPASSISYYGTPHITAHCNPEGRPLFRPQSNKSSITPLRSIIAKNTKLVTGNDVGPSPNLNSSKGRRVTFSFSSSSRVSSTNSSPLESVQEIEIHEEIQDENKGIINSVSSIKNFSERETSVKSGKNYVFEVTSTISSCVQTSDRDQENNENMQQFTEDSLSYVKGGLFSCVTNMFCSAVQTLPLWGGFESRNRSKRSRSPEREAEKDFIVVTSPLQKRPCYPRDLRLNPIRARKPMRPDQNFPLLN